jgi:hypothetical protein
MPIDTSHDRARSLRQRNPEAVFTEGVEKINVNTIQGVMDGLFANKAEMHKRCEAQLGELFAGKSYGRARAVGMTAAQASRVVDRAFSQG